MSMADVEWSDADESLLAGLDQKCDSQETDCTSGTPANRVTADYCQDKTHTNKSYTHVTGKASTETSTTGSFSVSRIASLTVSMRSHYLCVTDLAQQLWCEQHMLYMLLGIEPQPPEPLEGEVQVPVPVKTADRPEVKAGKAVHLARELAVHDVVNVKVTSQGEKWALHILNLLSVVRGFLAGIPVAREVPVFGDPFGTGDLFFGIIDELRFDPDTYSIHLSELKTRKTMKLPGKAQTKQHSFQVQIYKHLWDSLVRGDLSADRFLTKLSLVQESDEPLSDQVIQLMDSSTALSSLSLRHLLCDLLLAVQALVCINSVSIEYVHQDTGALIGRMEVECDDDWLQCVFEHCMMFWHGQREVEGVDIEEAWKCHLCEYASVCEWRLQKCQEYQQKNARTNS